MLQTKILPLCGGGCGSRLASIGIGRLRQGKFPAGAAYELFLHSTPVKLGAGTFDQDGTFSQVVEIPASTTPGLHRVEVRTGTGSLWADLTVTTSDKRPVDPTNTEDTDSGGSGTQPSKNGTGNLPTTGADVGMLLAASVVLLGAGTLILRVRKRTS